MLARLAVLKTYLGEPAPEAELRRLLRAASRWVQGYCGRQFVRDVYEERHRMQAGARCLLLREYPVWEIQDVRAADPQIELPSYTWDPDGLLCFAGRMPWDALVRVTYLAGYPNDHWDTDGAGFQVPEDLEQVVLALAVLFYKESPSYGEDAGNVRRRTDAGLGGREYFHRLPAWAQETLQRYRVPLQ